MKSPHTPRPGRDLPVRVPGSARPAGSGALPDGDIPAKDSANAGPVPAEETAAGAGSPEETTTERGADPQGADGASSSAGEDAGLAVPRLTQFSSLGSRGRRAGRLDPAPVPTAGDASDAPMWTTNDDDAFEIRRDPGGFPGPERRPSYASHPPAGTGSGSGSWGADGDGGMGGPVRRRRLRLVLCAVGVVAALSAGTFLITNQHDNAGVDNASSHTDSDNYGGIGTDWPDGVPPSTAGTSGKHHTKSTASPGKSPATEASSTATADDDATGGPDAAKASASKKAKDSAASPPSAPSGIGVYNHESGRCIAVVGGKAVQGAALQIWDCAGTAAQLWTFASDGSMRALGMCVRLAGGSTSDGTALELAACDGGKDEQFQLNAAHDLVNPPAGKCADARDNGTANGTRVQLWSCAGSDNQKWSTT